MLVRQPKKRQFWPLRTALVRTATGYRYLSGTGAGFLTVLWVLLLLCGAQRRWVTFVSDGARWLREFYEERLRGLPQREMVLDWWHLAKRCRELTSMIGKDRAARRALCRAVLKRLWQGEVQEAVQFLEAARPEARSERWLDELIGYLESRAESLVNYRQRRRERCYLGSGGVEKGNDQMVSGPRNK